MKIHGWKGVFSFSRPKTSTMVTFLKIRRQQWNRHLVSKRAQYSFVTVNTILVRSSFKGARISKTIHTLKCRNLVKQRGCQFFPPFFPTTRWTRVTTRETGPRWIRWELFHAFQQRNQGTRIVHSPGKAVWLRAWN